MDIDDLQQFCRLSGLYPGRLERQDVFSIRFDSNEHNNAMATVEHDLSFLQKIVFYNGNCRKVKSRKRSMHPHPLDISTFVFLCCNFIARQDLVLHFWGCNHAFPLVVKSGQLEKPTIYIWPLKSLVEKYNDHEGSDKQPVLDFKMKVVGAVSFGQQSVSKSNILNMMITESGKEHSFFFHRDLEGTAKNLSEICNGMIEAFPVLDGRDQPSLYLNLRGNCKKHSDQLNFVLSVSDIVVLLCDKQEVDEVKSLMQKGMSIRKKQFIIFCTDLSDSEEDINLAEELEEFCSHRLIDNLIVALKCAMRFDWMNEVLCAVSKPRLNNSIDNMIKIAEENYFDIDLDRIKNQIMKAEGFTNPILKLYEENKMQSIFPIHWSESLAISKADKEIYKLQHWKIGENVRLYRDKLEQRKTGSRSKQLSLIRNGKSSLIYRFLETFDTVSEKDDSPISGFTSGELNQIYIRLLKLNFERATRSNLNRVYSVYSDLLCQLRLDRLHSVEIQERLDKLDVKICNNSLSISHFVREMGHIYETVSSQCQKEECNSFGLARMLSAAVKLLLYGYNIELMDGISNYVSMNWVKGIISELKRNLGNIRIKVVSVLGIQSTGKSTLLNIMFGSQFAEGSGRCTRGLYLHLVKVSPDFIGYYNAEYVFVVDTEGLFTLPSESEGLELDQKDRELATFVIGISNVTIVNIMGENLSYLKDILPISVHAFLRMDLVGLNPYCVLLHQNVAKGNKYHLLQQTHHLERLLDDYTYAACKLENIRPKRFKEIIKFDIVKDVYYFPPLYQSSNPQGMINPQYSEDVESLKKDIMIKTDVTFSLEELAEHIKNIWEAVKRDNFVYEFKNTIEIKARAVIDREICHLQWKLRSTLQENLKAFNQNINGCTNVNALMELQNKYDARTNELLACLKTENGDNIVRRIPNNILGKSILKFQSLVSRSIEVSFEESRSEFANLFKVQVRRRQKELEVVELDEHMLLEIDQFLEENLKNETRVSLNVSEISDILFHKWIQRRQLEGASSKGTVFEEDAVSCIYSSFPTRHAKINERLEVMRISDRNMADFLRDIPHTYWSVQEHPSEKQMASELVDDMMNFLQRKLVQIHGGILDYRVGLFKDIVLHLRNHRYITEGLIHTKPVFEIDVAMASCGEFIQRFTNLEGKKEFINKHLTIHLEKYFRSKVLEIVLHQTSLSEAVGNFSELILTELCHNLISSIPKEIAIYMKNQYRFLSSKQGLLKHIYYTLIENLDPSFLNICLHSFELSARSCISKLFDSLSLNETESIKGSLINIIEEFFNRNITSICNSLTERIINQEIIIYQRVNTLPTMRQSINLISSALAKFLPMNSLKVFENDLLEDIEPTTLIRILVANLKKDSVRKKYLKSIIYQAKETEEYDNIRFETVSIIISPLIGCTKQCPLCGEVCCIGQMNHSGKHRAFLHKPTGMNGMCDISSRKLSSLTCWEELKSHEHDGNHDPAIANIRDNWIVPSDMCVDDNSFWKYIFVSRLKEIANRTGKDEPEDIPKSWYDLNRNAEADKLTKT